MINKLTYTLGAITRGDTASFAFNFVWKNPETRVTEQLPIEVANSVVMEIRNGDNEHAALIQRFTVGSGLTVTTDEETGKRTISGVLTSDITKKFQVAGMYYADMRFVFGEDVVTLVDLQIKVVSNKSKL